MIPLKVMRWRGPGWFLCRIRAKNNIWVVMLYLLWDTMIVVKCLLSAIAGAHPGETKGTVICLINIIRKDISVIAGQAKVNDSTSLYQCNFLRSG